MVKKSCSQSWYRYRRLFGFVFFLLLHVMLVKGQAHNAFGLGAAINFYPGRYASGTQVQTGFGGLLQGEIKLAKAIAVVPSLGLEIPYLAYIGLNGKYYIDRLFYAQLGGFLHLGGADIDDSGPGVTAAIGSAIISEKMHSLELTLHTDLMRYDARTKVIAGLRLTFNFSFSQLD